MDENAWSKLIIGAAIDVHRHLGPGLLESVYECALAYEFSQRSIAYERQKILPIFYRGVRLESDYRLDFLVGGLVIIELKAVETIMPIHRAQVMTYLKLSKCKLGLLLNFNVELMRYGTHRIVMGL